MRRFLTVLALCTLVFAAAPAMAFSLSKAQTRDVQEKLTLLGYEPGPIDGKYGPKTKAAVKAFQEAADLKVDGKAGPKTRGALEELVANLQLGAGAKLSATNTQLDIYEDVLSDRLSKGSVTVPSRFAKLQVNKGAKLGVYDVTLNGRGVAESPKGTGLLRITRTFELPGEDIVLFTARTSDRACKIKNTVMVVRADGSFLPPTEIGNCEEAINGRVQDRQVVFSFPPKNVETWRLAESWVYENGAVERR